MSEALPPAVLTARVLPTLMSFARDPVPNVRFNVAKALTNLATRGKIEPAAAASLVRPALASLAADADDDVRFYACEAAAVLSGTAH
jgi:serine/threonine-protein phosphatase 2A regulatory subunit A